MHLVVQCNKCGHHRAVETNNLDSYLFKCFQCGKEKKLRSKKGFNLNYSVVNCMKTACWLASDKNTPKEVKNV